MNTRHLVATVAAAALALTGCGTTEQSPPATATAMPAPATSSTAATTSADAHRTTTEAAPAAPSAVPQDAQKARVRRIVDGDTLEVSAVSAGAVLRSTQQVDVRLLEVNTPETKHPSEPVQCYGKQASAKLAQLLPVGSTVWVQRDQELRDRYGRYLLYLWNHKGTFVNLALVKGGYAEAVLYEPNDRHWGTISAAEDQARAANVGAWGACPYFGAPAEPTSTTPAPPEPSQNGGAYPVPAPPPDRDCGDISANNFRVRPGDPHRFDSNGDGIGCEG